MSSQGPPPARAFTIQYDRMVRQLIMPVHLSEAYDPRSGLTPPNTSEFQSVWDTGASACAISAKVVSALNLKPTGMTTMRTAGGQALANTYLINLHLPNKVIFFGIRVTEAQLVGNEDILIGMDIIGNGDFSVTNCDGKTCMSFRLPSQKRIDYVEEVKRQNAPARVQNGKQQQRQFRAQMTQKKRH